MPFTPSHAAAVLPFIRSRWFSATGLIAGSVVPDYEYFFTLGASSDHGHTLPGLLYFDLPVAAALSIVFHQVVKHNLITNLPVFLQSRFQDTLKLKFMRYLRLHWLIFITSLLLGAASHILWDNFTHRSGYFLPMFPVFYKQTILRYPMFYALQNISTYVGLAILIVYIVLKKRVPSEVQKPAMIYWVAIVLISVAMLLMRLMIDSWTTSIGDRVISFISGLSLALIITGFLKFRSITLGNQHGQENTMGAGRKA